MSVGGITVHWQYFVTVLKDVVLICSAKKWGNHGHFAFLCSLEAYFTDGYHDYYISFSALKSSP